VLGLGSGCQGVRVRVRVRVRVLGLRLGLENAVLRLYWWDLFELSKMALRQHVACSRTGLNRAFLEGELTSG